MKKTRFFLMALLLMTVLTFTACGNGGQQQDPVAGDQHNPSVNQNHDIEDDVKDETDTVRDDADRLGDDVKDDVEDAVDDVKDVVDGDDRQNTGETGKDKTEDNRKQTGQ